MDLNKNEKEILLILKLNNVDVRRQALTIVRGLTADETGAKFLIKNDFTAWKLLRDIVLNTEIDSVSIDLALDSFINATSTRDDVVQRIIDDEDLMKFLSRFDDDRCSALKRSMLLSNVTRMHAGCESLMSASSNFHQILNRFCDNLNVDGDSGDYRSFIVRNCSQLRSIRDYLLMSNDDDDRSALICKLFPLTDLRYTARRREAIVDVLRNCCFDSDNHESLIRFGDDFVCSLILPLAGPEEFDEEDNDKLPTDLQYLQSDKLREPDPQIRIKILEALYQLCATSTGRIFLRNHGVYLILREYHKWETNADADFHCGNVVNCLIRTEDEIGCDNLHRLDVETNEKSVQ